MKEHRAALVTGGNRGIGLASAASDPRTRAPTRSSGSRRCPPKVRPADSSATARWSSG